MHAILSIQAQNRNARTLKQKIDNKHVEAIGERNESSLCCSPASERRASASTTIAQLSHREQSAEKYFFI